MADDTPETATIQRAHEWMPLKRDVSSVQRCRVCGAVKKRSGPQSACYIEEIKPDAQPEA